MEKEPKLEGQMEKEPKCAICGEKAQIIEIEGEERFGGGWKCSCGCAEATYRDHSTEGKREAIKSWQQRVNGLLHNVMSPIDLENNGLSKEKVLSKKILAARVSSFAARAIDEAKKVEDLVKRYVNDQEEIEEQGNENPYMDVMDLHTTLDNIKMCSEQSALAFEALRKTSKK